MRFLILGLNYAPEQVGIAPYTTDLARHLVNAGHSVEVIAGEPYYPYWQRLADGPRPGRRRVEHGVGVRRCRLYIPGRPTGMRRILHHLSFAASALLPVLSAARALRPDVVLTVTPSLLSVPVAWLAARATGARLWTHVQDFEVEAAFATALLDQRSLPGRIARRVEHLLLTLADRVSSISPQMVARLQAIGVQPSRSYELRNWVAAGFVPDAAEAQRYRDEWAIGARKVVLYAGSIANKQGIDVLVDAARLLQRRQDIAFIVCGQGPNREPLRVLAADLPDFQIHDLQPRARLGGLLALACVHVLTQIPEAADLVLPSKLCNMLASRRPVVATAEPGTGLALEVEDCGLVVPPGDAAALAAAIERLVDDPALADRLGANGARRATERWGQSEILGRFEAEASRLARGAGPAVAATIGKAGLSGK